MNGSRNFAVVIVGGAAIGAAIAYFLKAVERFGGSVAVIERDPAFRNAATMLSAAGIRQQFSTPENIRLSRFGLQFLRELPEKHGPEADVHFHPGRYLVLAGEQGFPVLAENFWAQRAEGAPLELLPREELAARMPWLSVEGISGGTLSLSDEGWFDNSTLLRTLRNGAREAGAELIHGEAVAIETEKNRVVAVRLADG